MMQDSNDVFSCVKDFFLECFSCLSDKTIDIYLDELNGPKFDGLKQRLEEIVNKYKEFKEGHPADVFFLLTHRSIRAAFNDFVSMTVYNDAALLEGITTESEIDILFFDLENEYNNTEIYVDVKNLLDSCLDELYEIESEYQSLMVYTLNNVKVSSENFLRSSNRLLSEQQELVVKLDSKREELNKKSEKLNDSIDVTFKRLKTHEQKLEDTIKTTDKKIGSLVKKIKSSEKRMYEANITILGIFSAIVLTFSTTVNFFASVVETFSNANSYKLFMIILIVGLISLCALMGLFHYLWKVREDKQLNALIKLLDPQKVSKKKKRVSHICVFKLAIVILIVLMTIVSLAWGFGLVERRNTYISNTLSSQRQKAFVETNSISVNDFIE